MSEKTFQIEVKDKIARLVNCDEFLVCGNSDYDIHFEFDDAWNEYPAKTALFVFANTTIEKPFYGNVCEGVSVEKATKLYIGVFSGDLVTTTKAEIKCLPSIRDIAQTPKDPKPEVYNEIIGLINGLVFEAGVPSDEIPEMNGEGNPGKSKFFSRGDHVHPTDITRASAKFVDELAKEVDNKQDSLWFNGDYNEESNKVATESTVSTAVRAEEERAVSVETQISKKLDVVESIAKGAIQTKSYPSYAKMVEELNTLAPNVLTKGQNVMIGTLDVPDLWIFDISTTAEPFTYESEEAFAEKLNQYKTIKVGYYLLSALETQKVDLIDYALVKDLEAEETRAKLAEEANASAIEAMNTSIGLIEEIANDAKETAQSLSKNVLESIQPKLDQLDGKIDDEESRATQAESGLSAKIDEVETIAKGATKATSYPSYEAMIANLNTATNDVLAVGQSILIGTLYVPDVWVSSIIETAQPYTYESEQEFADRLKEEKRLKVGHYELSALETEKVDLIDYLKNTDVVDNLTSTDADNPLSANQGRVLDEKVKEATSIAKGANQAIMFLDYKEMCNDLLNAPQYKYRSGQNIYIGTREVPDVWIYLPTDFYFEYEYTSDEALSAELENTTFGLGIGYYLIFPLEAQKVDLDNYVKNTDYATSSKAGVVKPYLGLGVSENGGLTVIRAQANEIEKKTNWYNPITPSDLDFAVKTGVTTNTIELTEEEKKKAKEWLGVPKPIDSLDSTDTEIPLSANQGRVLDEKISEVDSIAKGANQAISYGDYATMINAFNYLGNDVYNVGQSILIITLEVPDLWVSGIAEERVAYTYVDDATFADKIKTDGSVQIGYYIISALETQKVDLANYVRNTDYATETNAGVVTVGAGIQVVNGKIQVQYASQDQIRKKETYRYPIVPIFLDYAIKVGLIDNKETWTTDEQTAARTLLGAVGRNDLATADKAGLVQMPSVAFGESEEVVYRTVLQMVQLGNSNAKIDAKATRNAIRNKDLDYAIKVGLTTNALVLTDEEKASAQSWLGVDKISDTVTDLGDTVTDLGDTVTDLGDTVTDLGDTVTDLGDTVTDLGDTVTELSAKKLYEHKITIHKAYNQGTNAHAFSITLILYRVTNTALTYKDIYTYVSSGTITNILLNDTMGDYGVPMWCSMNGVGTVFVYYFKDGSYLSITAADGEYTITDTVTEV